MNNKDTYYEKALEEIESKDYVKSIYAKAMRYSNGNDSKVKSLYIKYRVNSLLELDIKENNIENNPNTNIQRFSKMLAVFIFFCIILFFLANLS